MKRHKPISYLQEIALPILLSVAILLSIGSATTRAAGFDQANDMLALQNPDAAQSQPAILAPDQPFDVYLPILYRWETPPMVVLSSARTSDANGSEKTVYLPGDQIRYTAGGRNNYPINISINLHWERENPCGTTLVFSETLSLPPGNWQHTTTGVIPDCPGIYTSTVRVTNGVQTSSLAVLDVVNPPSLVVLNNQQGFDRCHLPSVPQMQTWWNSSPYWVFNIYLGGSMFYCDDEIPDAFWVHQVAGQGWKFILAWVGPQAPCSIFRDKMSSNATNARQQGRTEATAAASAASNMGFLGNRVIYYDMEAYGSSASSECRVAVASFMRGWTERLHELGYLAGGYGAPLTSHIADWASNNPAPDDVWIAHWVLPAQYNPDATVWSSYLSNSLWSNHQRIRQYAGGHNETWGGVTLDIDSNVLDGAITTIPLAAGGLTTSAAQADFPALAQPIRSMNLLSPASGWVLRGERLLITQDSGSSWQEVTPQSAAGDRILGAEFLDLRQGWAVSRSGSGDTVTIQRTKDAGQTWESTHLPPSSLASDGARIGAAYLDFIDPDTGWLALELESGSSFSIGRLFITQDGGQTWEEVPLPLGAPVRFIDARRGWTAGGPGGDQLYRTEDGGHTWRSEALPGLDAGAPQRTFIGLPEFSGDGKGFLPVTISTSAGPALLVYQTSDNGQTWDLADRLPLAGDNLPASGTPFSPVTDGAWAAIDPERESLFISPAPGVEANRLTVTGLPQGVMMLDFSVPGLAPQVDIAPPSGLVPRVDIAPPSGLVPRVDIAPPSGLAPQVDIAPPSGLVAWVVIQAGNCNGDKNPAGAEAVEGQAAWQCYQHSSLYATTDGGTSWTEITPPDR